MTPVFVTWWERHFWGVSNQIQFYPDGRHPSVRLELRDMLGIELFPLTALTFPA